MLTTTNTITNENTQTPAVTQAQDSGAASASDFQSFLMLLTAQLRNQDPLSPLDSTQFVEQLASFSAVEQQIETNDLLEAMASNFTAAGLDGAVQWIGKEVEVESGAANFQGEALRYRLPSGQGDHTAEIIVSDSSGNVVRRDGLSASDGLYIWDGKNDSGADQPHGAYRVEIAYYDEGDLVETKTPTAITTVSEARLIDGSVRLALENGALVDPEAISTVRNVAAPIAQEESS